MAEPERMHVVMFSAEATPFVKVGGLADVVGTLPKVLARLGLRVSVVLPAALQNGSAPERAVISEIDISMGTEIIRAEISTAKMAESDVDVFFIAGGGFFPRPGVYDDPETGLGYSDNLRRFTFFAKAGIEFLRLARKPVDVIHCHDSQTGLVPALLATVFQHEPFFQRTACLYTIHNLAYQGLYEKEEFFGAGIDRRYFYPFSPFEYWGKVNLMKAGIETADLLTTVSPTYAQEIQSGAEYGCGLEGVLRNRADVLYGIVNGIDYAEWDPASDPLIPARYSCQDLAGKGKCKASLLSKMGLPVRDRTPLIGIVSRLVDQKGFDLIGAAMKEIMARNVQMIVLGTGQSRYHELLLEAQRLYPCSIAVKLGFDNALAHEIEAGSDMFLMPSHYEPCGLNQLYSMRYGTVPIVRATGGLADTVVPHGPQSDDGTGFVFREYGTAAMMAAIDEALALYEDRNQWQALVTRGMRQRWTWETSALSYLTLYEKACQHRRARKYADS